MLGVPSARCDTAFYEKCGFSYSGLQMAKRIS